MPTLQRTRRAMNHAIPRAMSRRGPRVPSHGDGSAGESADGEPDGNAAKPGTTPAAAPRAAAKSVAGARVAFVVCDGFERRELLEPRRALDDAGATTHVIGPTAEPVQAYDRYDKAERIAVDVAVDEARAVGYHALVLPGGVINADLVRANPDLVVFVRHFIDAGKPIAAICHGLWALIEAEGVSGRHVTSWPSLQTDLRNAGALWTDEPVVVDRGLVTSRNLDDLPWFVAKLLEELASGFVANRARRDGSRPDGRRPSAG